MLTRIAVTICLWVVLLGCAHALDRAEQRVLFTQAKQALKSGNYASFSTLSEQLKDYPLYPYLKFADLERQLDTLTEDQVLQFVNQYDDTPLANRLLEDWLNSLARQQKWSMFKKHYQPTNNLQLQCENLQALIAEGEREQTLQSIHKLWLKGSAQPSACEQLFFVWYKSGAIDLSLLWRRIELAFASNHSKLVVQLIPWLPSAAQSQARLWLSVRANPNLVTQANLFKPLDYRTKHILLDGIEALAKKNAAYTAETWPSLQQTYDFSPQDKQTVIRAIAIAFARAADPDAMHWLTQVEPTYANQTVQEWRIRTALIEQDWQQVKHWINQLSPNEQAMPIWRYWHARALAQLGQQEAAQTIYRSLANKVDYYGLLASRQLNETYQPVVQQVATATQTINEIHNEPSMQRAYELYVLNLLSDARREWQWAISDMDKPQLLAATQLAKQWNWYDRMLSTAIKAGLYNDLTLRFPLGFQQRVIATAKKLSLDPAWVFAIMRQESNFMTDARSSVGAQGLMQLMPQTARLLLKSLHMDTNENVLNADINIQLGSRYLQDLYARYDGNIAAASAAYNVGPSRVDRFLPFYKKLGADVWVEILPWQETRNYVKQVTLNRAIYQRRLGDSWGRSGARPVCEGARQAPLHLSCFIQRSCYLFLRFLAKF